MQSFSCRLICDRPAPGAWNMAVDEALLADAAERGVGTLRFYEWSEPTLSLGYFQRHADRRRHAASRECAIVRRQTGGGAILHDRELTYSLTLPADHPLARQSPRLYAAVHDAFIAALMPLIVRHGGRFSLVRRELSPGPTPADEPFLCFQRRAPGDVLLMSSDAAEDVGKVLGSAQRRHRGAILQHGSLLVARSPAAPELPGLGELTGLKFAAPELAIALGDRLAAALDIAFAKAPLPPHLEAKVTDLANTKYGHPAWTFRR